MTTAFVLSGGGSLGAVQVGMLRALGERGVVPDVLVGTSAGAINAAFVGGHGMSAEALRELAGLWRSLRRRDVFALRPLHGVLAAAGVRPSLFTAEPLRRLVRANLGYRDLLDAQVELHLVTTDLLSGQEVLLSSGDAASAVVASAAIPGVFPPVCRQGRVLVDGGIAEHTAIRHAIDRGADEVYLLPAGYPCALQAAPATAVGVALQALTLLSQQQLIGEVARYAGPAKLKVLPPLCPLKVSAADFSHADELIIRAHKATGSWLDSGGPDLPTPQRFLSMHDHNQAAASATTRADQTPMELQPDR
ncbi:MAG TPA: patatin-like phospholipase family protein [Dermatophilaceae bacterium]